MPKFADVLNVHLIDVVSGGIVSTITHRRVRGPVNIIHSENWLVYTYYNEKVRRTELSTFPPIVTHQSEFISQLFFTAAVELYEGNTQANSTVWTSFDAPPLPAVEQQSYIIPSNVVALQETITEKGITHKHILSELALWTWCLFYKLNRRNNKICYFLRDSWPVERWHRWNAMAFARSKKASLG